MKLKLDKNPSPPSLFCGCRARSQTRALSERLFQKTRKPFNYAASPISTARYSDDDDERASLPESTNDEIPLRAGYSRTNEIDFESAPASPKTRIRFTWKAKLHRYLERWKKLGWSSQKGYRHVDDSLSEEVLSILFNSSADKDTPLDFLMPIQQDDRQTLGSIPARSSFLNMSLDAEWLQLELEGQVSDSKRSEVPSATKITRNEFEKEEGMFLGDNVAPLHRLRTPYPLLLSRFLTPIGEEGTVSNRHGNVCTDDFIPSRKLDTLTEAFQRPLIQTPTPTKFKRQLIYSSNEDDDEDLSFANSEGNLFELPGIITQTESRIIALPPSQPDYFSL